MAIVRMNDLHNALGEMPKEVSNNNQKVRTKAQRSQIAKTNVVPFKGLVGDYTMVHSAN